MQIPFHSCHSRTATEKVDEKADGPLVLAFAAAWVCRWALRLDLSEKDFSQTGQPYGFSPGDPTCILNILQMVNVKKNILASALMQYSSGAVLQTLFSGD